MTTQSKAAWVAGLTFIFTALVTIFRKFEPGYINGIWLIWFFFAWNYFAYAFDRDMWPWIFDELKGKGNGKKNERSIFFWGSSILHLSFLATMAFAD